MTFLYSLSFKRNCVKDMIVHVSLVRKVSAWLAGLVQFPSDATTLSVYDWPQCRRLRVQFSVVLLQFWTSPSKSMAVR